MTRVLVPAFITASLLIGWNDVLPAHEAHDYEWVLVTRKASFAPRDGAGALVYEDRMWLLGGWNPGDKKHFPRICNNEVWSSKDGAAWDLMKANTFVDRKFQPERDWEGRHTAGYVVHRGKMWIVGGDVNQGHYHFDVWNSGDGKEWTHVNKGKPVPWGPRALHYTVAFKNKIWVMGGQTIPNIAAGAEVFYRDIWSSVDGVNWHKITPREPYWSARGMIGGSAVFKDRIWILGGGTYDTPKKPKRQFFNDVWSSADGVTWEKHGDHAPWTPGNITTLPSSTIAFGSWKDIPARIATTCGIRPTASPGANCRKRPGQPAMRPAFSFFKMLYGWWRATTWKAMSGSWCERTRSDRILLVVPDLKIKIQALQGHLHAKESTPRTLERRPTHPGNPHP
jgi:hypothetical protein